MLYSIRYLRCYILVYTTRTYTYIVKANRALCCGKSTSVIFCSISEHLKSNLFNSFHGISLLFIFIILASYTIIVNTNPIRLNRNKCNRYNV